MDLIDLIVDSELQQDEWSLSKPTFGDEQQIEVVGWLGPPRVRNYCVVMCKECQKDEELFGEGYFRIKKSSLLRGNIPCGCSRHKHWSKEEYRIRCSRKAESLGYKFLGFVGQWEGSKTRVKLLCTKHGEWDTGSINNLLTKHSGCLGCKGDKVSLFKTQPVKDAVKDFLSTGQFHQDTTFQKIENRARRSKWIMVCGECGERGESDLSRLKLGQLPCACSRSRQREAYINLVIDSEEPIAIKFGITINSGYRTKRQLHATNYKIKTYRVYKFPDVFSCKKAERDCLQELECGILLKRDFPDGYTETTWAYNLEKIIEIYERNGGVRDDAYV